MGRLKTALNAGYAALAIWASHLIVDGRKYAVIQDVGGFLWSDLVLYALFLTVLEFLLLQFVCLSEANSKSKVPFESFIYRTQ